MKHFEILMCFDSPQVKWYMKFSTKNIVYDLPLKFPNDLRLRILGNEEITEKFQKWVEAELSTQSPFQEKKLLLVVKNYTKASIKVSYPVQFCLISWYCLITFSRDCSICLNNFWMCLIIPEYVLICLNMPEYTWIYLNLPECFLFYMSQL